MLPEGEFGVYVDGPDGPSLQVFGPDAALLADRPLPALGGFGTCLSIATDPAGGWWLTAMPPSLNGDARPASLHRLPHRDATFTSTPIAVDDDAFLSTVVAVPGGVMVGGSHAPPGEPARVSLAITFDEDLTEEVRWDSNDLGHIVRLERLDGAPIALAQEPSIDYGDAFILRFANPGEPPTWIREVGTLGDAHDAIQDLATTDDSVFLFKTSREAVPGSEPFVPGDPSTLPPQQSRSVVEARDSNGDVLWTHEVIDDKVDVASIAATEETTLAWRGAITFPPDPGGLELSAFEVLNADGECTCAFESPILGRIVDIEALHGEPAGSFIVTSELDQTFKLSRVRVLQQ